MDINNLTSVYNQNPTLQGQYTLPEYLSLFNQGEYTPIQPTPTDPTPTDPTPEPGIPNIINQNLNQGGGDGGDNQITTKSFNRNDLLGTADYFPGKGFKETIGDGITGIVDYAKTGGIFGNVIRGIFGKKKNLEKQTSIKTADKARDKIEAERKAKEVAAKQEIERQAAYAQARQDRETYRDLEASITRGDGDGGRDRPDSGPTATGAGMGIGGGHYADYYGADGGSVRKYFKGGIVSLRRR